jgi:tRNA (guanine-N7-)-methyltransferase
LSGAHREALTTLMDRWSLDADGAVVDPVEVFGRRADLVLDIGCGMGDSTRAQAAHDPASDVIALDVHTRGIATLLRGIESDGLDNVRVVLGDAVEFVEQRVAPESLAGVRIYFPDPWPKARHQKRRLSQPEFVRLLSERRCQGGFVHCATDDGAYAEQMLEVFDVEPSLRVWTQVPATARRPVTKYERRARRLGHPIRDIYVTRTLSA